MNKMKKPNKKLEKEIDDIVAIHTLGMFIGLGVIVVAGIIMVGVSLTYGG